MITVNNYILLDPFIQPHVVGFVIIILESSLGFFFDLLSFLAGFESILLGNLEAGPHSSSYIVKSWPLHLHLSFSLLGKVTGDLLYNTAHHKTQAV